MYEELRSDDILTPTIVGMIKSGMLTIRGDKIEEIVPIGLEVDAPWIYEVGEDWRKCRRWNKIYFRAYGMISRNCFNCWKIVCRPKTLKELMTVRKIQKRMRLSSKCGAEEREGSKHKGLYAAFWYCPPDLEEAKKLFKKVELEIKREVGFQTPVILKRACTEMEEAAGPSDKWFFPRVQHSVENYLDGIFVIHEVSPKQPDFLKIHIMKEWIEYARRNRDLTHKDFCKVPELAFGGSRTATFEEGSATTAEQPAVISEGTPNGPELQGLSDYI